MNAMLSAVMLSIVAQDFDNYLIFLNRSGEVWEPSPRPRQHYCDIQSDSKNR
jgi:hypothetical protein